MRTDIAPDAAPHAPSVPSGEHEHRWTGVEFFLEDDHPRFRSQCACGAERVIRAWERYWDPAHDIRDDSRAG